MSIQEMRALGSLVTTILVSAIYTAVMMQRYPQGDPYSPDVFQFWGAFLLILIPVAIVAQIVLYIVVSIVHAIATREEDTGMTDERDKLIELKTTTTANYVFVICFALAMVALVLGMPPAVMFAVLFCGGIASSLVSDISQFYFYRRGV